MTEPAAGGVLLAAAAALQDLGPLVLGDHPLDLDQEVLRRVMAEGVAEEDDLDAATGEFFEDQDLIGILAGEPIRVEDVEAVDGAGGGLVAEPLQPRPGQQGPADAVVDEPQLRVAVQAVVADAPLERLELAGDRVLLGLLLGGDPGVDRHAEMRVRHGGSSSLGRGLGRPGPRQGLAKVAAPTTGPLKGAGDDGDEGFVGGGNRPVLEPCEFVAPDDEGAVRRPA